MRLAPPKPHSLIRSMFIRRLLLVGGGIALGLGVLASQTWRLSVVKGDEMLGEAERRMISERWTPTVRGRILDRKGRVLAVDRPAFDVMVSYDVITGDWAYNTAAARARSEHKKEWAEMDRSARERLIGGYLERYALAQDQLWRGLSDALNISSGELEERRHQITAEVERMANAVWDARLEKRRAELSRDRELTVEVTREEVSQPIREQKMPHAIATGVDEETAFRVRRLAERFDGISLDPGGKRSYPYETMTVDLDKSTFPPELRSEGVESVTVHGVATHILGWMRPIYAEDVAARPKIDPETGKVDRGHYRHGDRAGRGGIEESHERELRGLRGYVIKHRDTGWEETVDPVAGKDVRLTLDVDLQARVQAVMEPEMGLASMSDWHRTAQGMPMEVGTPLNGAAVVLDIDTGEILAMVSTPTFTRDELETASDWIFRDPIDTPWVNRAIGKPYAPGSPIKPLILTSAVTSGVHRLDDPIACTGYLLPNQPNRLRCWVYKEYGTTHNDWFGGRDLYGDDAICVSCNIYFYTLGGELGVEGEKTWLGKFGVGHGFGLGIGPEFPGSVGVKLNGEPSYKGDAIMMGIGQGPVSWTPLHAADAYATIARGGQRIVPRIVKGEPVVAKDLHLDPEAVDTAMRGLKRALNDEMGTGYAIRYPSGVRERIIDIPGIATWGKTGTATSPPILGPDPDGDGPKEPTVLRSGDNAWFLLLVGHEGELPRYAIAVVMEYAGSGGRVSGPIAAQIVYALEAEGYL